MNDDGTACGVDNVDDTMLRVTNAIRDAVQRGTARPYYLQGKGIRLEGVYVF